MSIVASAYGFGRRGGGEPFEHRPIVPLIALAAEEHAELILEAYLRSIRAGDWRASASLLERVYGKPRERVAVEMPETPEQVEELTLAQVQSLRRRLEVIPGESSG